MTTSHLVFTGARWSGRISGLYGAEGCCPDSLRRCALSVYGFRMRRSSRASSLLSVPSLRRIQRSWSKIARMVGREPDLPHSLVPLALAVSIVRAPSAAPSR